MDLPDDSIVCDAAELLGELRRAEAVQLQRCQGGDAVVGPKNRRPGDNLPDAVPSSAPSRRLHQPQPLEADHLVAGDQEVVVNGDPKRLAGFDHAARHLDVRGGRRGRPARMIMHQAAR